MIYEGDAGKAVDALKEFAFRAAFFLTVLRRDESEIAEAILLSKQYQLCRKHAGDTVFADAMLKEVIEPQVEQGRYAGHQEIERQKNEADQLRNQQESVKAEAGKVRSDWMGIEVEKQEIERAKQRLKERELRVNSLEDVDRARQQLAEERERISRERIAGEEAVAAEKEQVEALAAQVREQQAKLGRSRLAAFLVKLAGLSLAVLLLFAPARDTLVRPYLAARAEASAEKYSLEQQKNELAAAQKSIRSREVQLSNNEIRLGVLKAELDEKANRLAEQDAQLSQRELALQEQSRLLDERSRRERAEIEGRQRLAEQRISYVQARETQFSAAEEARRREQEEAKRRQEEVNRPVNVTLVNGSPDSLYAVVVLGGTTIRFNGPGSTTLSLRRGKYSYSVNGSKRCWGPFGWFAQVAWGSGYVEVTRDNQRLSIAGQNSRLWITSD